MFSLKLSKVKLSLCLTMYYAMKMYLLLNQAPEDKVVPVLLTKHHAMKAFLDLGTRWRWVVRFTPRLPYS